MEVTMSRHSMWAFSLLLGVAFLVWPSRLISADNPVVGGELVFHLLFQVNNAKTPGEQIGFEILQGITEAFTPKPPAFFISAIGIADERFSLGSAAGSLVPIPGAINSCCCAAGVVVDPGGRFVLTTDSGRNRVCVQRRDPETSGLTPGARLSIFHRRNIAATYGYRPSR